MKEVKRKKYIFFMLKSVLKCIESIGINKNWVKNFQNSESQLGGRGAGGSGQVGQKPTLRNFVLTPFP